MSYPATPTEKKRLLGNPGKRPIPDPQVVIPESVDVPTAPEHLGEVGLLVWERVWRNCSAWVSPNTDIAVVTRYCETFDQLAEMKAILERDGLTVEGTGGTIKAHPLIKPIRDLEANQTKYEGLLGLNPSDRSKMGLVEIKKQSEIDKFLNRGTFDIRMK